MSEVVRRAVGTLLLLIVGIVSWRAAFSLEKEAARVPSVISMRYSGPGIPLDTLRGICRLQERQEKGTAFSACAQFDAQKLCASERQATASVLTFYGEIGRICHLACMQGALPSASDLSGCALDADTAYQLWGSHEVVGETFQWEGREYIVRAVFRAPAGMVLIPAQSVPDRTLFAVSLDARKGADAASAAEEFCTLYGLPSPDAVLTRSWAAPAGRFFALLPLLALGGIILWQILRELWAVREMPVLFGLAVLGMMLTLWGAVRLSGVRLVLPQNLIPTRWSDFSFWSRTIGNWAEGIRFSFSARRILPDRALAELFSQMSICSALSTGILLFLRRQWKAWWGTL